MTLRLAHIGKDMQSRIKRLFDAPLAADATPLEISQAVLDDVERKVQPVGRGRRVFPYSRLIVRIAPRGGERAAVEAAFANLDQRIRERLAELRCELPTGLETRAIVLRKVPADWPPDQLFAIDGQTSDPDGRAGDRTAPPNVHITVLKGTASRRTYSFADATISIGRTADVAGGDGRTRRNRVVFLDTADGVTETVGRAHAHLRFDARAREYRLFDDGSSNGTSIVRHGGSIAVPSRDPRGVRVCTGDEVQVGRAVLRIVIGVPEPDGAAPRPR